MPFGQTAMTESGRGKSAAIALQVPEQEAVRETKGRVRLEGGEHLAVAGWPSPRRR